MSKIAVYAKSFTKCCRCSAVPSMTSSASRGSSMSAEGFVLGEPGWELEIQFGSEQVSTVSDELAEQGLTAAFSEDESDLTILDVSLDPLVSEAPSYRVTETAIEAQQLSPLSTAEAVGTWAVVPEPMSWLLQVSAFLTVGATARWRRGK